jgi:hypothetical protein
MNFMRALLLALGGLFGFSAFGQRSVILEEQIDAPFRLAVDGYLQNSQPLRRWVLKDLPADSLPVYIIPGRGGPLPVFRYLHLPGEGYYRYVVTRNFAGKLQLRYRGQVEEPPREYAQVAFSRDLEYRPPQVDAAREAVAATQAPQASEAPSSPPLAQAEGGQVAVSSWEKTSQAQNSEHKSGGSAREAASAPPAKSEKTSLGKNTESRKKQRAKPADPTLDSAARAGKDTTRAKSPRQTSKEPKGRVAKEAFPALDTLRSEAPRAPADSGQVAVFARELQTLDYEFEKLAAARRFLDQFSPVPQAIPRLLAAFRYDQSRVDFINEILAQRPEWEAHLPEWLPYLDYEMSRRKLEKKWHEK